MAKRAALGKGIEALFDGVAESGDSDGLSVPQAEGLRQVPRDRVAPNPNQPRKEFAEESLKELADSIKEKGILQPILVEEHGGTYTIIAGERRWRAAGLAGLKDIPVIVRAYSGEEKLEIALIENIQRDDLTPIEEARAYKELMSASGLGQEELAAKVGKPRSTLANALRLLKLPAQMQDALNKKTLSPGHARAILSVVNPADMHILFQRIIDRGLSVREAEAMADDLNKGVRSAPPPAKPETYPKQKQPELRDMEEKLLDILGTRVRITGNGKKGSIEISYLSMDDLNRLFDILAGNS
ncbi:MAG: ParB/RepB/Spo0J family partition protein [Spirochaetales bacterium]|nr:ParB/RepB/Spo0J family partition protein [Spirochaetales bacterium]